MSFINIYHLSPKDSCRVYPRLVECYYSTLCLQYIYQGYLVSGPSYLVLYCIYCKRSFYPRSGLYALTSYKMRPGAVPRWLWQTRFWHLSQRNSSNSSRALVHWCGWQYWAIHRAPLFLWSAHSNDMSKGMRPGAFLFNFNVFLFN